MAGERPTRVRERHGGITMNESPVLGGVHSVEDIGTADDFSKKHVPYVAVSRDGDKVTITVEVGHYVAHPNLPDHWIEYVEILANGAPIMTVDFAAGVVAPSVVANAMLDPGTKITVYERCNLHGVWVAEATA
jgi:desulfoferrodoxin-like iron-binding protein